MKKILASILTAVIIFTCLTVSAFADCGPKSSVTVRITGIEENRSYYATLLSRGKSTGPDSAYYGTPEGIENNPDEIWKAFVKYEDADGYYYLQKHWAMTGSDSFCWGYYPPRDFKILLYFPDDGSFISSEPLDQYAFNTYYTARTDGGEISVSALKNTADYANELGAFLIRVAITVCLELMIAFCFGYRERKALKLILIVNIATQLFLNIVLNAANFKGGPLAAALFYLLLEIIIFAAEAVIYGIKLPRLTENRTRGARAVLYALTANLSSFIIGGILAAFLFSISDSFSYI